MYSTVISIVEYVLYLVSFDCSDIIRKHFLIILFKYLSLLLAIAVFKKKENYDACTRCIRATTRRPLIALKPVPDTVVVSIQVLYRKELCSCFTGANKL